MSRKKKTSRQSTVKHTGEKPDDLPAIAAASLAAGRFKDAAETYKTLLKHEKNADWIAGLAAAYHGRAHDLAAKDMLQEALALWRTRSELCGLPLVDGPYAEWLIRSGDARGAFDLLRMDSLSAEIRAHVEARLAPAALSASDESLTRLPADSALLRHRPIALAALAALAKRDEGALEAHLRDIPFRSPYRDLRLILKALNSITKDDTQSAAEVMSRLNTSGPFEPLAAVARAALLPPAQWLATLNNCKPDAQQLLLDLAACPLTRRPFVLELARLGATPNATALIELLQRHRQHLPVAVTRIIRRLLPHDPGRFAGLQKSFGFLNGIEEARVYALEAELSGDNYAAEGSWLTFVDLCDTNTIDGKRMAAQALRRISSKHHHPEEPGGLCQDALEWIARSVALDPHDRESLLKLIRATRARQDLKTARGYLDAAMRLFPDDADILIEAVETALAGNSFKKAAGLAKRVLALDPINPRVRSLIGQSHLGHARKHLKSGKIDAAQKELDDASQWLRTNQALGTLALLRGLAESDAGQAAAKLREAMAIFKTPALVGAFILIREAAGVLTTDKRQLRALLKQSGVAPDRVPAPDEVIALMRTLDDAGESLRKPSKASDKGLATAFQIFHDPIARSIAHGFNLNDHLYVSEALSRHGARLLAMLSVKIALRRWPDYPAFVCLDAEINWGGDPWDIPQEQRAALELAANRAHLDGDPRTVSRIDALLDPPSRFNEALDNDTPIDTMGNAIAELEIIGALGGEKAILELAKTSLGPAAFAELERAARESKQSFAAHFMEMLASLKQAPFKPATILPPAESTQSPPVKRQPKPASDGQRSLFDD